MNKRKLFQWLCAACIGTSTPTSAQDYIWSHRLGSTGTDKCTAVTVDNDGGVYVTGSFKGTVDFDHSTGVALHTATSTDGDIFVLKYDHNGDLLWVKTIGGAGGENSGNAITLDAAGNVLVTGHFSGTADFDADAGVETRTSAGMSDFFVLKLDAAGVYQWAIAIGDIYSDAGTTVRTDAANNIYIGGVFANKPDFDPGSGDDRLDATSGGIFFTKYNKDGVYQWARNIGCNGGSQSVTSLDLDAAGHIYLAGSFNGPADFDPSATSVMLPSIGLQDIYLASYDASGNYLWAEHGGNSGNAILLNDMKIGKSGTITITGTFYDPMDFDMGSASHILTPTVPAVHNIFLAQYDLSGQYKWAYNMGSSIAGGGSANGASLSLDDDENIFLTGHFSMTTDFDPGPAVADIKAVFVDMFFAKYDHSGNYLWAQSIPPASSVVKGGLISQGAITTDHKGSIYLAGRFFDTADFDPHGTANMVSAGDQDGFVVKYNDVTSAVGELFRTQQANLVVYPNPAYDVVTVQLPALPAGKEPYTLSVYDLSGRKITTTPVTAGNSSFELSLARYVSGPGMYFIRLSSGNASTASGSVLLK